MRWASAGAQTPLPAPASKEVTSWCGKGVAVPLKMGLTWGQGPGPQSRKGSGAMVDKRLKSMMKELGNAINNSLSDSDQIAEVISRIKAGGYDVFVVLEATIGFNQRDEDEGEPAALDLRHTVPELEITAQDVKFLKSLRIAVEDEN
jgi:hypothetical protein